jgi:putative inorganic carbon (HCO3(-)) transporter
LIAVYRELWEGGSMDLKQNRGSSFWSRSVVWILAIGLFVQLSGKVWLESNSAQNTQVYIWLLLPAAIFFLDIAFRRAFSAFSWEYLPWMCFLLWGAISVLWSTGSEDPAFSLMKRGLFIALYLVSILLFMRRDESTLLRVLMAGVAMITLGALVSLIYQFLVLEQPLAYRAFRIDRSGIRDFANYGWPVAAGIFHGAAATWALGFALDRRRNILSCAFWLLAFCILVIYVLLTYTRGAWFGVAASCLAVVILQNSRRGWLFFVGSAILAAIATFMWWDNLIFEVTKRQLSGRGPIWDYFFSTMPGHWLVGHGLGTPFNYVWPDRDLISPHAHSLYFQQVYDSGLISLALMAAGLLGVAYKALKLRKDKWVRLATPALIFALISMMTDVERVFTRPGDYWTVFWLPIAILLAVSWRSTMHNHNP